MIRNDEQEDDNAEHVGAYTQNLTVNEGKVSDERRSSSYLITLSSHDADVFVSLVEVEI